MNGKGETKASVHEVVVDSVLRWRNEAAALASSVQTGDRVWQTPLEAPVGLFNIEEMSQFFDREDIGHNYAETMADPDSFGTAADALALKIQNERIAMEERAFRTENCSPIRSEIHAAARRIGHAHPVGVFGSFQTYLEDLIRKGGS